MKLLIFMIGMLYHGIHLYCQETTYQIKGRNLLEKAVEENQCVGIAAGFSVDGEVKWMEGAGFSDLDDKIAFDGSTISRLASITKSMTAIAIMQLYELGLVDLDQPIQTYVPTFPIKKEGNITIRQLLQHSSGLGGYQSDRERENETNYPTLADAIAVFRDRDLISLPGKEFHYSTYGYVLLGLIIEEVSGVTYEQYLRANIWDKVGMNQTGIEQPGKFVKNKAEIYHRNSKGKIKKAEVTDLSDRIPGGGIYSTVSDMLKFGHAVLANTLINAETLQMMIQIPELKGEGNPYGFGWYLYGVNPTYGNVFGHNGAQTGASTFLMLLPEQKTVIVVLSNTSGAMQEVTNITIGLFDVAAESIG
jgi:CubicO group peptidase (beta-lactamase class C family)